MSCKSSPNWAPLGPQWASEMSRGLLKLGARRGPADPWGPLTPSGRFRKKKNRAKLPPLPKKSKKRKRPQNKQAIVAKNSKRRRMNAGKKKKKKPINKGN